MYLLYSVPALCYYNAQKKRTEDFVCNQPEVSSLEVVTLWEDFIHFLVDQIFSNRFEMVLSLG